MLRGREWEGWPMPRSAASGCRWRENGRGLSRPLLPSPSPPSSLLTQAEGLPDPSVRLKPGLAPLCPRTPESQGWAWRPGQSPIQGTSGALLLISASLLPFSPSAQGWGPRGDRESASASSLLISECDKSVSRGANGDLGSSWSSNSVALSEPLTLS